MPSPNSLAALRRVPTPLLIVGGLPHVALLALLGISSAALRSPHVALLALLGISSAALRSHLVVVWALLNGLQIHSPLQAPTALIGDVIDKSPPPPENSPRPDVELNKIHFTEPPPRPVHVDTTDTEHAVTLDNAPPPLAPPTGFGGGTALPEPIISAAGVDPHHPLTQPPYPMSEIRGGAEGALLIALLVGVDGRVRDAKVAQSSGFERLDQAALSEAKQHWHLKPATRNGIPFEQWLTLKVVFRLEDR